MTEYYDPPCTTEAGCAYARARSDEIAAVMYEFCPVVLRTMSAAGTDIGRGDCPMAATAAFNAVNGFDDPNQNGGDAIL